MAIGTVISGCTKADDYEMATKIPKFFAATSGHPNYSSPKKAVLARTEVGK